MILTISDSISLAILNSNALITGIGNELHLYTSDNKTSNRILPIKLRGKVHGIVSGTASNCDQLLVYGEKEYLVLRWTNEYAFETLDRGFITDWISAANFLKGRNNIVLLCAHSTVVCLQYCPHKRKYEISQRSSCSDKSTLYSALIHGDQWSQLVCFGGNAYGELLIWRPTGPKAPLIQRISSHNGVIFSINYSAAAQMLTTTSDDRSIKFWRVDMRVTSEEWSETKLIPVASGFGHIARVFQAKIIKSGVHFYAVSAGEDSYLCIWRMNGELIHKTRQQFGAIIWNLEYDETNAILYTVGSTGNVLPFPLQDIIDNADNFDGIQERNMAVLLPRPKDNCMKNDNISHEHYVAKLKFLNSSCLVALTNKNQLICYRNQNTWDLIDDFTNTKCTVLEVKQNKIAICGYKRLTLYRYQENTGGLIDKYYDSDNILSGLIRAFIFLTPAIYLICDESGNCLLLQESLNGSIKELSISLPKCKEPWLTSAVLVQLDILLISNRQGNMFLYRWNTEEEKFSLAFTLKHPHGHLGATLIKLVANSAETAILQSAGHDGTIKYIKLCKSEATLKIIKRENVPVCWVEALEPMEELKTELLLGFNDNHFIIWSRLYDFHVQLPCGGGHRYWDYFIYEKLPHKSPRIKMAFIKNKQVLLYDRKLLSTTVVNPVVKLPLRNMWHTKPCNVLKCIESTKHKNAFVIISGGDDNLIKLSIYDNVEGESHQTLRQMNEIHSHISNIRTMAVLKIKGDDYLIFSGGGRAQLCVTKLNIISLEFEEMLNIYLKTITNDSIGGSSYKDFAIDPEMRIMSLDVLPSTIEDGDGKGYTVFIGCSDGFVRKYKINKNWEISLLGDIHYGKCILQVRLVGRQFLLIAATDGLINYCSLDLARFDKLIQHHLSGVNAMDIRYSHEMQELQVLTGGDDQAMVFSKLSISSKCTLPTVLETVKFETLHTAQVTGVQLSSCGYYAFSSSVDQNLLKTDLRIGKVIKEFHTCVADIKGLCVDSCDNACMVYGCGLQIYSFN